MAYPKSNALVFLPKHKYDPPPTLITVILPREIDPVNLNKEELSLHHEMFLF